MQRFETLVAQMHTDLHTYIRVHLCESVLHISEHVGLRNWDAASSQLFRQFSSRLI